MRRDKELIRRIVLDVADSNTMLTAPHWEDEENNHEKVGYHIWLLKDAGYLQASFSSADDDPYYIVCVSKLTWEGQDLADALRSQNVWAEVKARLEKAGITDATIDVLKSCAVAVISAKLGLGA